MSFIKITLNSLGTAAGVAWPLFGILFSALSLTPLAAIPLCLLCSILFIGVFTSNFYISYTQEIEEERHSQTKFKLKINQLLIYYSKLVCNEKYFDEFDQENNDPIILPLIKQYQEQLRGYELKSLFQRTPMLNQMQTAILDRQCALNPHLLF